MGWILEEELERIKDRISLLAGSGDNTPDFGEGAGSLRGSEATADLELGLDHSQVPFGLVVIEGDAVFQEEAQDFVFPVAEAIEEVQGLSPFGASTFSSGLLRLRIDGVTFVENFVILSQNAFSRYGANAATSAIVPFSQILGIQQQFNHFFGHR